MARDLGGDWLLAEIVPRLMCHRCRVRPDVVEVVDNPQIDAQGYVGGGQARRVRLPG
jgi:hypothetical protein